MSSTSSHANDGEWKAVATGNPLKLVLSKVVGSQRHEKLDQPQLLLNATLSDSRASTAQPSNSTDKSVANPTSPSSGNNSREHYPRRDVLDEIDRMNQRTLARNGIKKMFSLSGMAILDHSSVN
ncbi:hypothetical protein TcWFU_010527 [Taenia crassiceps]|uniref:Uncharacterized protein n=1 Tax=Taenia crassiceps TaxID=6207 RepID=A0ABR4PZF0_9CEST